MDPLHNVLLDPRYHDALSIVKGIRNGLVYGAKIRAPHALVMTFLFKGGTLRQKLTAIFKATSQHACNLATYVTIYKICMITMRRLRQGKTLRIDSLVAGFLGGYIVFGDNNSINQQIVLYVFSRIVLGFVTTVAKSDTFNQLLRQRGQVSQSGLATIAWPLFASFSWASVMYLHDWHPTSLQPSLANSMRYLYDESDQWTGLRNFIWHSV